MEQIINTIIDGLANQNYVIQEQILSAHACEEIRLSIKSMIGQRQMY